MDQELERQLEESIAAVTALYRAKQLPEEFYYKAMLCNAYEYAAAGELLRAASIAQGIPRAYYQQVQRRHMEEDSNYAYVAYSLALSLFQAGFVHLGPATSGPLMKPASA